MSQTYESCTTNSNWEQQRDPHSLRSALASLLYRRKKALEESQLWHDLPQRLTASKAPTLLAPHLC
jgi:hypothetical protein